MRVLLGSRAANGTATVVDRLQGVVVASTGNGSVHRSLLEVLDQARAAGVAVLRATRCAGGGIVEPDGVPGSCSCPSAGGLTPAQARVELMLRLLGTQEPPIAA